MKLRPAKAAAVGLLALALSPVARVGAQQQSLDLRQERSNQWAAQLVTIVQDRLDVLLRSVDPCETEVFWSRSEWDASRFKAERILDPEGERRKMNALLDCEIDDAWRFSLEGGLRFWDTEETLPGSLLSLQVSQALGMKIERPGERMDIGIEGRTELFRRRPVSDFLGGDSVADSSQPASEAEFNTLRCFIEGKPSQSGGFFAGGEFGIKDLTTQGRPFLALEQRETLSDLLRLQQLGLPEPAKGSLQYEDTRIYCQATVGYEAVAWGGRCRARLEVGATTDTSGGPGTAGIVDSRVRLGTSRAGRNDDFYLQVGGSGRLYADGAGYCSILLGAGMDIVANRGCVFRMGAGWRYDVFTDDLPASGDMESFFRDRAWGDSDGMGRIMIEGTLIF